MALEIVVGFASDMMEHVDVEGDISSCYSIVNGNEPSSPSLISSTGSTEEPTDDAVEYCQCPESDDEAFIECQVCGSFMSLALTAPCFVISLVLGNRGHSPKSPYHVWRDGVVVTYLSLFDIVQILELHG
jgi:hypothetical protein